MTSYLIGLLLILGQITGGAEIAESPAPEAPSETPMAQAPEADWERPQLPPAEEAPDYFKAHQQAWESTSTPEDNAGTPQQPENDSVAQTGLKSTLLRSIAVLAMLCGLIILGGYLLRRFGRRTPLLAGQDLAKVLGRVHLSPRASLHFVRSGGRILVLGVTQQSINFITEYDAEHFEASLEVDQEEPGPGSGEESAGGFLAQLRSNLTGPPAQDSELTALRGDIQRLQEFLHDSTREQDD